MFFLAMALSLSQLLAGVVAEEKEISYITVSEADLAKSGGASKGIPAKRAGRKWPPVIAVTNLNDRQLPAAAVPLPEAETLAGRHFRSGNFGRVQLAGGARYCNREVVLVKFREAPHVSAVRVEPLQEIEALQKIRARKDVEFAELDFFQERQFTPQDPLLSNQWHHSVIGSFEAWRYSLGESSSVRIAIVDTPFEMNHPDLVAHTDNGWDVVDGLPIVSASGIDHSTLSAGMAAAVINNGIGLAGAINCRILPININGATSEMYDAIIWAADHGVRVVNISWTGAYSDTLNTAAAYLKEKARGVLAMPGVNGSGFLNYTNQPNIYCISMTDAADNARSRYGNHIDFSAPGFEIFSTTTNANYGYATGTSFATPLFCGVVAGLFGINPALSPEAAIDLLKATAVDLGPVGWDPFFGFGRIDFGAAAASAQASRVAISHIEVRSGERVLTVTNATNLNVTLWKSSDLISAWEKVGNAIVSSNNGNLTLTDPFSEGNASFYRVEAELR